MKLRFLLFFLNLSLFSLLAATTAYATHVRAGEITTRRISSTSLTYEITLTVYFDERGGRTASEQQDDALFCFGVGGESRSIPRVAAERRFINPNTTINIYRTVYTYPGPGTYSITTGITNRNDNTRNIPGSVNVSFQLRTTIVIGPNLGLNSTPVMLNPPLDSARVGQKFCHNPAAYDADGDSLAYRLYTPSGVPNQAVDLCTPRFVTGYVSPERIGNGQTEAQTGPATLTIDPRTGDLCWDSPAEIGQYNIAFIVEEWRDGVKIGEIVRDMQIVVTPSTNRRPELRIPEDLCVEAGTNITQSINATDPDNNRLQLQAYGGVFNLDAEGRQLPPDRQLVGPPFATFTPAPTQILPSPVVGTFRWQTACVHVREEPYDVIFRVVDFPGTGRTQLATIESFRITVYAPRPQNLTARPTASQTGRAIQLNWNAYACIPTGSQPGGGGQTGAQMIIYRREGCSNVQPQACQTGIPAGSGYTEIARVPLNQTNYLDTTQLRRGVQYSYRIVASFARPRGGQSVVSQEVCLSLPLQVPVLTNVTVDSTDAQRGRITVRWTRPIGVNPGDLGAPYEYRLFRTTGLNGTNFTQIATIRTDLQPSANDTTYIDRNLNTVQNAYRYRLEFFFTEPGTGQLTRLDATEPASSVRLSATPQQRRIQLSWQANTPWSNENSTHRIYRSRTGPNGPWNRVADVTVTAASSFTYVDTGTDTFLADGNASTTLSVDSSYCYRVETVGAYTTIPVRLPPLLNFSQGVCASPIDSTRPCPPILSVDSLICANLTADAFCDQTTFTNNLTWRNPTTGPGNQACDRNIVRYNVYYSRYEEDSLKLLTSVQAPGLTFQHNGLTSFAGCYVVTAVSRSGIESAPSNRVCKDNCPQFSMPNVFTPNGDGKNDVLQPLRCPSFVESLEFVVFNRWGAKVFETTDLNINWAGKTTAGQDLPSGLYYYQVKVRFATLNRNSPPVEFKGWVQLIRDGISR